MRKLVHAGVADNAQSMAKKIVSMSAVIKLHLGAEDGMLYPALANSSDPAVARTANMFRDEMGGIAAAYTEFARKWKHGPRVAAEPEQFRKDANNIFKALHQRVQRENQELYPLAEQA